MEKFSDYLYYLLTAPFRKVAKATNCWWALACVLGEHLDELKDKILWLRLQGMILCCDPLLLPYHGEDRDMPRLKGEDIEGYRRRLCLKQQIAQQAGTNEGIITAVRSLGYDSSYIEPLYKENPDQWSEFRIWLQTAQNQQVKVNDFEIINLEVMKVKPASSMPTYATGFASAIELQTRTTTGSLLEPRCGALRCGQYPPRRNEA